MVSIFQEYGVFLNGSSALMLSLFFIHVLAFINLTQTKKLRDELPNDMSVFKAFTLVLERRPELRLVT